MQPFEPAQLIVEFRPRTRISLGKIETCDQHAIDRRLDIAALHILRIVGQPPPCLANLAGPTQQRDPVLSALPMPDGRVAGIADRRFGKDILRAFKLLQDDDIGLGQFQSAQ